VLRLVHSPPDGGQALRPSKGRRSPALMLSANEERNLRQVLRNLRLRYGSWSCLGEVMGVRPGTLVPPVRSLVRVRPAPAPGPAPEGSGNRERERERGSLLKLLADGTSRRWCPLRRPHAA
jgi:hypothetical protein